MNIHGSPNLNEPGPSSSEDPKQRRAAKRLFYAQKQPQNVDFVDLTVENPHLFKPPAQVNGAVIDLSEESDDEATSDSANERAPKIEEDPELFEDAQMDQDWAGPSDDSKAPAIAEVAPEADEDPEDAPAVPVNHVVSDGIIDLTIDSDEDVSEASNERATEVIEENPEVTEEAPMNHDDQVIDLTFDSDDEAAPESADERASEVVEKAPEVVEKNAEVYEVDPEDDEAAPEEDEAAPEDEASPEATDEIAPEIAGAAPEADEDPEGIAEAFIDLTLDSDDEEVAPEAPEAPEAFEEAPESSDDAPESSNDDPAAQMELTPVSPSKEPSHVSDVSASSSSSASSRKENELPVSTKKRRSVKATSQKKLRQRRSREVTVDVSLVLDGSSNVSGESSSIRILRKRKAVRAKNPKKDRKQKSQEVTEQAPMESDNEEDVSQASETSESRVRKLRKRKASVMASKTTARKKKMRRAVSMELDDEEGVSEESRSRVRKLRKRTAVRAASQKRNRKQRTQEVSEDAPVQIEDSNPSEESTSSNRKLRKRGAIEAKNQKNNRKQRTQEDTEEAPVQIEDSNPSEESTSSNRKLRKRRAVKAKNLKKGRKQKAQASQETTSSNRKLRKRKATTSTDQLVSRKKKKKTRKIAPEVEEPSSQPSKSSRRSRKVRRAKSIPVITRTLRKRGDVAEKPTKKSIASPRATKSFRRKVRATSVQILTRDLRKRVSEATLKAPKVAQNVAPIKKNRKRKRSAEESSESSDVTSKPTKKQKKLETQKPRRSKPTASRSSDTPKVKKPTKSRLQALIEKHRETIPKPEKAIILEPPAIMTREEVLDEIQSIITSADYIPSRSMIIPTGLDRTLPELTPLVTEKSEQAAKTWLEEKQLRDDEEVERQRNDEKMAVLPYYRGKCPEDVEDRDECLWSSEQAVEAVGKRNYKKFGRKVHRDVFRAIYRQFESHVPMEVFLKRLMACNFDIPKALETIDEILVTLPQPRPTLTSYQAYRLSCHYEEFEIEKYTDISEGQQKVFVRRQAQEKALCNFHLGEVSGAIEMFRKHYRFDFGCNCHDYNCVDLEYEERWACSQCTKRFRPNADPTKLCLICKTYEEQAGSPKPCEDVVFYNYELEYIKRWVEEEEKLQRPVEKEEFLKIWNTEREARWRRFELTEVEKLVIDAKKIYVPGQGKNKVADPEERKRLKGDLIVARLTPHILPHIIKCRCSEKLTAVQKEELKKQREETVEITSATDLKNYEEELKTYYTIGKIKGKPAKDAAGVCYEVNSKISQFNTMYRTHSEEDTLLGEMLQDKFPNYDAAEPPVQLPHLGAAPIPNFHTEMDHIIKKNTFEKIPSSRPQRAVNMKED